jgi:hypothetical protein
VFEIAKGGGAGVWSSLVGTATAAVNIASTVVGGAVAGPAGAAAANKVSTAATTPTQSQNNVSVETRY